MRAVYTKLCTHSNPAVRAQEKITQPTAKKPQMYLLVVNHEKNAIFARLLQHITAATIDIVSLAVHESLYSPMHIYSANLLYIPFFAPFVGVHIFTEHYFFPLVIL